MMPAPQNRERLGSPSHSTDFRLHHIGVITKHLNASMQFYASLGYTASPIYPDPLQQASIVLMHREAEPMVELIAPTGPDSPAATWIERIQSGPYHTAYEVDQLETMITCLRSQELYPVLGPMPAIAFDMRRIVFLWGECSGLLELVENTRHAGGNS